MLSPIVSCYGRCSYCRISLHSWSEFVSRFSFWFDGCKTHITCVWKWWSQLLHPHRCSPLLPCSTAHIHIQNISDEFCCQTVHHPVCSAACFWSTPCCHIIMHFWKEKSHYNTSIFPPKQLWWWKRTDPKGSARDAVRGCSSGSIGRPVRFIRLCGHWAALAVAARLRFSRKGQDPGPCESVVSGIRAWWPSPTCVLCCLATLLGCRAVGVWWWLAVDRSYAYAPSPSPHMDVVVPSKVAGATWE